MHLFFSKPSFYIPCGRPTEQKIAHLELNLCWLTWCISQIYVKLREVPCCGEGRSTFNLSELKLCVLIIEYLVYFLGLKRLFKWIGDGLFFSPNHNLFDIKIFREGWYCIHLNNLQGSGNSNEEILKCLIESLCQFFHCKKMIKILTHLGFIFKAVFKSGMMVHCHCIIFLWF